MYRTTEHKKALTKLIKEKRMILLMDAEARMNKTSLISTAKSLADEGIIKMQKIQVRGKVGNLIGQWLLYSKNVKQQEILTYEQELINKEYVSPLKKNHCYKKVEQPVTATTEETKKGRGRPKKTDSKTLESTITVDSGELYGKRTVENNKLQIIEELKDNSNSGLTMIENNIIPIYGNNNQRIVNARELHEFMQVKDKFATWITRRIEKYDFAENVDYRHVSLKCETPTGLTIRKEYYLTMNMAKEIAMLENNQRGKYIRKYFIEVEEKYKQQNSEPSTNSIKAIKGIVNIMEEHDNEIKQQRTEIDDINMRLTSFENKIKLLAQ